jgi:mono/diheme cytochrome c family protein
MLGTGGSRHRYAIIALIASLMSWRAIRAEEPERLDPSSLRPLIQSAIDPAIGSSSTATMLQPADQPAPTQPAAAALDPGLVAAGQSAFSRSCTTCHEADRSLQKSKSYSGWLATVRRMASKTGAEISSADAVPIATYLASVAGGSAGAAGAAGASGASDDEGSGWSFGTTISTLHRSASDAFPLENPGFFADVWVTANYQSSGPWRANVTACTSCHSRDNGAAGNAYSLELVEGSATLDLRHMFHGCHCDDGRELLLKAGRFIVPFGAISAMSNPSTYRTVTQPLMFNMGRRVFMPGMPPNQPVLPAPFSDEGIDLTYRTPVLGDLVFTLDTYAINGLQGNATNIFNKSRAYFDNNEDPTGGARMTLSGEFFRLGTSVMSGNLADQGQPRLYYTLAGADATAQITDRLRFYFEYAMRHQNSAFVPGTKELTFGTVTQLELRLWNQPYISALVRYDTLDFRNQALGSGAIHRITSGFNIGLPGDSLLMINHERWEEKGAHSVDVLGIRWAISL